MARELPRTAPEVENVEATVHSSFSWSHKTYAGLKRVVSEFSNDTKHDVVWWEYHLQKWVKTEHIKSRQSFISGFNHVGVEMKCAPFSLAKSRIETIAKLKKLWPNLSDTIQHRSPESTFAKAWKPVPYGNFENCFKLNLDRIYKEMYGTETWSNTCTKAEQWELIDLNKEDILTAYVNCIYYWTRHFTKQSHETICALFQLSPYIFLDAIFTKRWLNADHHTGINVAYFWPSHTKTCMV